LAPREDGDNDMMSKFLNVSDGLIKITNKKMIFTTNINQVTKIDPALLRPGRCFGAVEFRELTSAEAARAAAVAGVVDQDWTVQDHWSLAQIFTQGETASSPKFRMGFG
jgi:ATP-dependent 26S proteasome regulatory subunit